MSTRDTNNAILDQILGDATIHVLAEYGLPISIHGPSPALSIATHDAVGVIGFTGDGLRGTLVLATSTSLVASICPIKVSQFSPRDQVRDWVGELANLMLGRIKIDLGRRGISVGLSTPVAFTGERLRLGAVQRSRTRSWDFDSKAGRLRAWIEVELAPELVLSTPPGPEPEACSGEPLFF